MNNKLFRFTVGLNNLGELYEFDSSRSTFIAVNQPVIKLFLTRPLIPNNPISRAVSGTRFPSLTVRQYDIKGILMKQAEYKDAYITKFDPSAPDLILEFTYKP